ncbi:MAG: DUF3617 domain-containing protein [Burkholderiaceae bacterium]|nr:DUF3617 domain-containing protein [Burkholderiaceae bacterium]
MNRKVVSLLLLSGLCWAGVAWSAGFMKAGLWEVTVKSDMMQNMPKIPPEQIEKMKQMGINVPQMQGGAMMTKVCVSKEMAERDQMPTPQQQAASGCQAKNFQHSGDEYSVDIVCDGPDMQGTGTSKGRRVGSDGFTSTYQFKGTAHGHPVDQHVESNGKFISADCGDVKPFDAMKMK